MILMGSTNKELQEDFRGNLKEGDLFGKGMFCVRKDFSNMGSTSSVGHVGCQWMDSRGRDLRLGSMNHVTWELRKSKRNCIFFALPQVIVPKDT